MNHQTTTALYILGCIIVLLLNVLAYQLIVPLKYKEQILFYCNKFNLPPDLIFAVVNAESKFNPHAKSSAGAEGLMQLTHSTAQYLANQTGISLDDVYDVDTNLHLGCYYLSVLINKYQDTKVALCAYNAGPNTVDGWLNNNNYSQNGKNLLYIPFKETRNYVRKIDIFRTFYINIYNF